MATWLASSTLGSFASLYFNESVTERKRRVREKQVGKREGKEMMGLENYWPVSQFVERDSEKEGKGRKGERSAGGGGWYSWNSEPAAQQQQVKVYGGGCGASGACFGLLAVVACRYPWRSFYIFPLPVGIPALWFLTAYGAFEGYCIATDYLPQIGHWGHLGGLAGGVAIYFTYLRTLLRRVGR